MLWPSHSEAGVWAWAPGSAPPGKQTWTKERPVQVPLSWVCVSEPYLRVSYTRGSSDKFPDPVPGVPVSRLAPRIWILSQADVRAAGGKLQAAPADAEVASPTAPFTPSSMMARGGVPLQLGLAGLGGCSARGCASPAVQQPGDESE